MRIYFSKNFANYAIFAIFNQPDGNQVIPLNRLGGVFQIDHEVSLGSATRLANAAVGTIRLKLLKIRARVVHSVRRIVIHLAGG